MAVSEKNKISLLLDDLSALEGYIYDLFIFAPLPICFISPLGVILEANPAFEKLANYEPYAGSGESLNKLFQEEDARSLLKEALEKETIEQKEMKFFPKGGEEKIVLAFTRKRKGEKDEAVGFFLGLLDITTLKNAEKELKEAQTALLNILEDTEEERRKAEEEKNKTQAIITNFSDGLLVFDKQFRLTLMNPRAEEFFDIKKEKIIGKSVSDFSQFSELQPLATFLGGKLKKIFREELEIDEDLILEVSTIEMRRGRERLGILVVLHDVTREKMVERLKTEFVSISAHQLRTPLSAIKWTLRMLLDGDLGKISTEQRDFLEKTYRSNERMISLVNSLLNVTRIEEGRFVYKPVLADIKTITESVLASLKDEIRRKKIRLKLEKPKKDLPKILVDVEKISSAVQNLVDNAIKYTLPGGQITISLKQSDKGIEFMIKDSGVGIPKKQQKRVFEKFFRGANVMRLETEGSGLGLFITKNIIEAHGGKIWFKSQEGKGATFCFILPIKRKS